MINLTTATTLPPFIQLATLQGHIDRVSPRSNPPSRSHILASDEYNTADDYRPPQINSESDFDSGTNDESSDQDESLMQCPTPFDGFTKGPAQFISRVDLEYLHSCSKSQHLAELDRIAKPSGATFHKHLSNPIQCELNAHKSDVSDKHDLAPVQITQSLKTHSDLSHSSAKPNCHHQSRIVAGNPTADQHSQSQPIANSFLPSRVADALLNRQRVSSCNFSVLEHCCHDSDVCIQTEWGEGVDTKFFINTGGSIWGISWLQSDVAIGGYHNTNDCHIIGNQTPSFGTVQIWRVPLDECVEARVSSNQPIIAPTLKYCIHHHWGACLDLKWWPGGTFLDQINGCVLGYLGCIFADGGFRILELPREASPGVHIKLEQVVFEDWLPSVSNVCFDWGGTERLAIGRTDGFVLLYDVAAIFLGKRALVTHFPAHDTFLRSISFQSGSNLNAPLQFVSCGSDGRVIIWDSRDIGLPVMSFRSRGFLVACEWSRDGSHIFFADSDYLVRAFQIPDVHTSHMTVAHKGSVWCIASSTHHTYFASTGADGTVKVFNPYLPRARRGIEGNVYAIAKHQDGNVFEYSVNSETNTHAPSKVKTNFGCIIHNDPSIAVHAASWNATERHSSWLASGARNGLLRIDQIF